MKPQYILSLWTFFWNKDFYNYNLWISFCFGRMRVHWVLFSIELLGILVLNSVTLAVIANYVTHCEMVLFYLKGLALRLQEKSTELKAAMKVSH